MLVALIAAGTAQWRLRVQLRREDVRLSRQLSEQGPQLSDQLSHDRRMADIADLRQVLETALNVLAGYQTELERVEQTTKEAEVAVEALTRLNDAGDRVFAVGNRLRIRLGRNDRLVDAYDRTWGALEDVRAAVLIQGGTDKLNTTHVIRELWSFMDLAKQRVGSLETDAS